MQLIRINKQQQLDYQLSTMIEHLLELSKNAALDKNQFEIFQIGQSISQYNGGNIDLKNIDIALLFWKCPYSEDIRQSLYALTCNFKSEKVVDLGIVAEDIFPLIELIDNLLQNQVLPILITPSSAALQGQLRAYEQKFELLNLAIIDSKIPFSTKDENGLINTLLPYHPHLLFHLHCIGYQSYISNPQAMEFLEDKYFELQRLGFVQNNLEEVEPMMRDADLAAFSMSAIRCADAPANFFRNPNGFQATEACRIMRYITMSDRLSSLCIYDFDLTIQDNKQTANMIAQLIWFAMEGFYARLHEFPISKKELRAYVVDSKALGIPIHFYKSSKSDRWWFEIPKSLHDKHQLIPCSYRDYQTACEGELPDRLLNAIHRLS